MGKKKKSNKQATSRRKYLYIGLPILTILLLLGFKFYSSTVAQTPTLPEPPLKQLAKAKDISLGNFAIRNHLDDKPYTDILTSQFDFVLADNTPNWYFTDGGLRPSRTTYNFKQMDEVMSFAKSNNMPVQAHHYVWGEEK